MIKLFISDIDGVWTDSGMYYLDNGVEAKRFSTSDGVGLALAKLAGIDVMVISGEDIPALRNRMNKLKVEHFHLGIKDKVGLLETLMEDRGITFDEIAFIGDEVNDHALLRKVGIAGCPQSAPYYTKEIVDIITESNGGMGAFRDFVIEVLKREGKFDTAFQKLTSRQ